MNRLLEAKCLDLARELAQSYSDLAPPFSLQPLIEHFGIERVRERPLDRDACLRAESGRLFIDVNSMYPLVRRRLSIAHEIGHLIVKECSPEELWGNADPATEALCNRLAGTLLAPELALRRYFESASTLSDWQDPIRCSTVVAAASAFGISVDAMAARVFHELGLAPGIVAIIWRFMENALRPGSEKAIRIASVWHKCCDRTYIPRNKTLPADSLIARAFRRSGVVSGIEQLSLGTLRGKFRLEALGFGLGLGFEREGGFGAALSLAYPALVSSAYN